MFHDPIDWIETKAVNLRQVKTLVPISRTSASRLMSMQGLPINNVNVSDEVGAPPPGEEMLVQQWLNNQQALFGDNFSVGLLGYCAPNH